jgi:hypothetical protein
VQLRSGVFAVVVLLSAVAARAEPTIPPMSHPLRRPLPPDPAITRDLNRARSLVGLSVDKAVRTFRVAPKALVLGYEPPGHMTSIEFCKRERGLYRRVTLCMASDNPTSFIERRIPYSYYREDTVIGIDIRSCGLCLDECQYDLVGEPETCVGNCWCVEPQWPVMPRSPNDPSSRSPCQS